MAISYTLARSDDWAYAKADATPKGSIGHVF